MDLLAKGFKPYPIKKGLGRTLKIIFKRKFGKLKTLERNLKR